MRKESFVFHKDFIEDLPDEYKPVFAMYAINYGIYSIEPELTDFALTLWKKIKRTIDSENHTGARSPNWKGGVSSINHVIRNSQEYKYWRKSVFQRDEYTCQSCGAKNTKLNAHHIKRFAKDIANRFNVENGITLCVDCHKQLHKIEGK